MNRPLDDLQAIVAEDIFHRGVIFGEFRAELDGAARGPRRDRTARSGRPREAPDDYFDGVVELTSRLLGEQGESLQPGRPHHLRHHHPARAGRARAMP